MTETGAMLQLLKVVTALGVGVGVGGLSWAVGSGGYGYVPIFVVGVAYLLLVGYSIKNGDLNHG